jgi:plastocyanin
MTTPKSHPIRITALLMSVALAAVTGSTIFTAPAYAATQAITITTSGFVPADVTIKTGDTVSFTNSDTAPRQVVFRESSGFTCTVTPLVIQPATSQSCTWTAAGNYSYSDPNQRANTFKGTVTVASQIVPAVSLAASSSTVRYGNDATLSGKVTPSVAGTTVDILAMATGQTAFTKLASVVTNNSGAYNAVVTPEIGTSYRAEFQSGTTRVASAVEAIQVRPQVRLVVRSIAGVRAYLRTAVISSLSYAGKYVLVQRQNRLGSWSTVKRVTLGAQSASRFSVRLPSGTSRIRIFLPASQAGSGYVAAASRTILVTR